MRHWLQWGVAALGLSCVTPAVAVPIIVSAHLDFSPASALTPSRLDGQLKFYLDTGLGFGPEGPPFDVAAGFGLGTSFDTKFIPVDPCLGARTCQLGFSFGGTTNLLLSTGSFFTAAFVGDPPNAIPSGPPIIPVDLFSGPSPIPQFDPLFAYDAPVQVGDITIAIDPVAVPEPPALPLFGIGIFAALGFSRRRRKNQRCSPACDQGTFRAV